MDQFRGLIIPQMHAQGEGNAILVMRKAALSGGTYRANVTSKIAGLGIVDVVMLRSQAGCGGF